MLDPKPAWTQQAACKAESLDIFFPNRYTENTVQKPFALCQDCPVRIDCLHEAITTSSVGIWGGTTDYQRFKILDAYFNNNPKNFKLSDSQEAIEKNIYSIPVSSKYLI